MSVWAAHVITVSDGVYHGVRQDDSGDLLAGILVGEGFEPVGRTLVADEPAQIKTAIVDACQTAQLVLSTGGTGFGPRDVTPEATLEVVERAAPGIVHLMLTAGVESTPMAALSRPVAGAIGRSLVINLPGSPRGASENLNAILPVVPHALRLLGGDTEHRSG